MEVGDTRARRRRARRSLGVTVILMASILVRVVNDENHALDRCIER
jgi:hypothetical protein